METQVLDRPESSMDSVRYAGFWIRVLAFIIDIIIIYAVALVLGLIIFGGAYFTMMQTNTMPLGTSLLYNLLLLLIQWFYFAGMESSKNQATVGKRAVGIKVVDFDGQRVSFGQATGRYFAKILSALILYIGFIMVAFHAKKQGLHDILAKTYAVYK